VGNYPAPEGRKKSFHEHISALRNSTELSLREPLAANAELARKVEQHDRQIAALFEHAQHLLATAPAKKNPIGFVRPKV